MGYDRGDSFPFDFEPNGILFGSENWKENCHHEHIPFNVKGIGSIVFSVYNNETSIIHISVLETSDSRHHKGPIEGPLIPLVYHNTIRLRGLREPLTGTPLCQETPEKKKWFLFETGRHVCLHSGWNVLPGQNFFRHVPIQFLLPCSRAGPEPWQNIFISLGFWLDDGISVKISFHFKGMFLMLNTLILPYVVLYIGFHWCVPFLVPSKVLKIVTSRINFSSAFLFSWPRLVLYWTRFFYFFDIKLRWCPPLLTPTQALGIGMWIFFFSHFSFLVASVCYQQCSCFS